MKLNSGKRDESIENYEKNLYESIWITKESSVNLEKLINNYSKKDLIKLGQFWNIQLSPKYSNIDIINILKKELPISMQKYISNFIPEQHELLSKVARAHKGYILVDTVLDDYSLEQIKYFTFFLMLCPIEIEGKKALIMLPEIKEIFKEKRNIQIKIIQKQNLIRRRNILGMFYFYGVISKVSIISIYKKTHNKDLLLKLLDTDLKEIDLYWDEIQIKNDLICSINTSNDIFNWTVAEIRNRRDLDYKLYPPKDYFNASFEHKIFVDEHNEELYHFFSRRLEDDELFKTIIEIFRTGGRSVDAYEFILSLIQIDSDSECEKLFYLLNQTYNNTPHWVLKGHSPKDLSRNNANSDKYKNDNVVSFVTGNKIGRNDPCPCGSSKKFNNCCLKIKTSTLDP